MSIKDKELQRDRFVSVLGACLRRVGFDEAVAGSILTGIRFARGKVETDFAYHLTRGAGVLWGYSNGGVAKLPLPIDTPAWASGLAVDSDKVASLVVRRGMLQAWSGFWLVGFELSAQTDGQQQIAKLISLAGDGTVTPAGILAHANGPAVLDELKATLSTATA